MDDQSNSKEGGEDRRQFLEKTSSICAACALGGIPAAAGIAVITDPLSKGSADAEFINIGTMESVPDDGTPQKFTVRADKQDAWSRFPDQVIGAVYIRRLDEKNVQAYNVVCPHLGCAIHFRDDENDYFCPCHNSAFDLKTGAQGEGSPSAWRRETAR